MLPNNNLGKTTHHALGVLILASAFILAIRPTIAAAQRAGARSAHATATQACGVERWRVKILADEDRGSISWSPETTSIASLRQIPAPRAALPATRRIAPHELTLYRVRAVIRQVVPEQDGDWHVVLADPDHIGETLVTEIPDSACALGSGHEGDYAAARRSLRGIPRGALVELDGIGFFDYLHGQRGMAPNGFELHPVVAIRSLDDQWEAENNAPQRTTDGAPELRQRADSSTRASGDVQVWLNTNSLVYHCADSRWYGKTKSGEFMRESEAVARGARAAYGRRCTP
jgi:hypothetical protein